MCNRSQSFAWASIRVGIWLWILVLFALFGFACPWAKADGFIIPVPPPHLPYVPDLSVRYHRVQVQITNQVAQTSIDQVFVNEASVELEGTYIFPLPEDAAISEFAMFVDGQRLSGRMLDKDEARRIYNGIVQRRKDPALLEYLGRNAFQASIYPIPARGEKRVQLEYSEVLDAEAGLVYYRYPLNTERFSSKPLEEVVVVVEIHSQTPIKAVYSPSHDISIERQNDRSVIVSYEANDVRPDTDFELYYTLSADDIGLNLLSYKEPGNDGFFLLLMAPRLEAELDTVVAKDVVLVLDVSGSMEGKKLAQAQAAIRFVLDHLHSEDRFNIVAFSTGLKSYAAGMRPSTERGEAKEFLRGLHASGGTDIQRALQEALAMADGDRPQFVIFVTDGLATAGVTDTQRIIDSAANTASESVRLFTFGVGYDVNTILLDTISEEHRGASAYVEPNEDIEEEIADFYTKVSTPLLSDLKVQVEGVLVDDLYPYPLPDLFAGGQLLVLGRYRSGGSADVTLRGTVNGELKSFTFHSIKFASRGGEEFVPRLWATRKVGYLLRAIRLHGENRELVDIFVRLAVRYGIMTPYTSFLVDEDSDILTRDGQQHLAANPVFSAPEASAASGAKAVADSQVQSGLVSAERGGGSATTEIRQIGNKTFVLRGGVWTDTTFDPQAITVTRIPFGGEAYQELLDEHPESSRYLAVGDRLILVIGGTAVEVSPDAVEPDRPPATPTPQPMTPWQRFLRWFRAVYP
jgi:Ca-activated chloride channel homolog